MVVCDHDDGVMQAVGDEPNASPAARAGHDRLQGFEASEASPEREALPLRRRRLPVLPVKPIADHPGRGRCRAARRQGHERPPASGSALSARTLPAGSRAGTRCADDAAALEDAEHGGLVGRAAAGDAALALVGVHVAGFPARQPERSGVLDSGSVQNRFRRSCSIPWTIWGRRREARLTSYRQTICNE